MKQQKEMFKELKDKTIFEQAQKYAYQYSDQIEKMDVFPSEENLQQLNNFDEPLASVSSSPESILQQLNDIGGPGTIASTGGRYFGFVTGGAIPVSIATKWLADFWDQCGGLHLISPVNAKLETVCEAWLKDLLNLPERCVAGFVSGTSMANFCGLAAARYRLLKNQDWDVNTQGLNAAPAIRIVANDQVHSSIKKTIALLGFGINNVEWVPSDNQGRILVDQMPKLDNTCLVLVQAGNVNSGAFDDFNAVCKKANAAGAWVHIDGAFGLWAAASETLSHLIAGMEKANSWAVDGHKTLNTPYDSGIVFCEDKEAMVTALQASGEYIVYSEQRDSMLYTPEMSKRSRAIELWATMKYLGKNGIDEMVTGFHLHSKKLAEKLLEKGFNILNDVVFNQVMITCESDELTERTLKNIQESGEVWCGPSKWQGQYVIRVSVCSWATTEEDISRTVDVFEKARVVAGE